MTANFTKKFVGRGGDDSDGRSAGKRGLVGALVFLLILGAGTIPVCAAEERPNVLFIAVDDLRPELGAYGSRALTPNIDRLAASGLLFNRAYCNQAVCGASRLAVMTGMYPEFTGERSHHVTNWRSRHPGLVTLNQVFRDNGYNTVGLGKIYHAWDGVDVDIENWDTWIGTQGFRYVNPDTMAKAKETAEGLGKAFERGPTTEVGTVENAEELYFDGWRAREAVRQLERLTSADKPFFLAVGFSLPHLPFAAPKKYWDLYNREDFEMPENLGIPPGYPEYAANQRPGEMRGYADVPPGYDPKTFSEEMNKRLLHGYFAAVSYVDRNIGLVLDALRKSGKADNTIIILWSDHGWKVGDHSTWTKHTNFEVDARVPLIIYDPRNQDSRGVTDALVELIDLYPTLIEVCGLPNPVRQHGQSFKPVLVDPSQGHRDFTYSSYPKRPNDDIIGHSIRNGQYRYTEWWEAGKDEVLAAVLTDLAKDPGETTNIISEQKEVAGDFSKALKTIVHQSHALPKP